MRKKIRNLSPKKLDCRKVCLRETVPLIHPKKIGLQEYARKGTVFRQLTPKKKWGLQDGVRKNIRNLLPKNWIAGRFV